MKVALLVVSIFTAQVTGSPDADAKLLGQALAWSLEKCAPRAVVAEFKAGWCKNTWGPPTRVDYDVLRTASLKWPYRIVITYEMPLGISKDYKTRKQAEEDPRPSMVFKYGYKNIYEIGDDGSLRLFQTLQQPPLSSSEWTERTRWSDACWDQLPKPEKP